MRVSGVLLHSRRKKCLVMAFPNHLVVMALNQRKKIKDCKKNIKIDKLKKYIETEQVLC